MDSITDSMDMNLGKLWEMGEGRGGMVCHKPVSSFFPARLNSQSGTEKHCEKRALLWMDPSTATETNKPQLQRPLQEADQAPV